LAFEFPSDLPANWVFRFWVEPGGEQPRQSRQENTPHILSWLDCPLRFLCSALLWGWLTALLQTALLIACSGVFVEVLLVRFRKIPFTRSYPAFQSHSTLVLVPYLIGFVVFAIYIPQIVRWSLVTRWGAAGFIPAVLLSLGGLRQFRKQMLDMDKQLVFEQDSASGF